MSRRIVPRALIVVFVVGLCPTDAIAEEQKPIAASVTRAAAKFAAQPATKTRIPPAYLWTGVGLLGAGALTILSGVAVAEDRCEEDFSDLDCGAFKAGWIGVGVAEAGVGALLIALGNKKRVPVTNSLQIGRRSVKLKVRW